MNTKGLGFLGLSLKMKSFCERSLKSERVGSESEACDLCLNVFSKTFTIQRIRQTNININDKGGARYNIQSLIIIALLVITQYN